SPKVPWEYNVKKECTLEESAAKATMAHTYVQLYYHIVWSTKDRLNYIPFSIEEPLHVFLGGAFKTKKCLPFQIGGMSDHIHILVSIPPTIAVAEVIRNVKVSSTKWMHKTYAQCHDFAWQEGYGAFSVSESKRETVIEYIKNQKEHHQGRSFQDEFLLLLEQHNVTYDPKYLWK
ncbi:MAG: IS200/IS605 family transposase, partial [Chlamydiales bacterium]|nr:IS200/IS605 family transposase [Chlamydiales bacterium]